MSPIDRELEQALATHAADLIPPADLLDDVEREARGIRRRRGALVGAAALSVLAIAIAVPLAMRESDDAAPAPVPFATEAASPTPTASESPGIGQSFADLGWPARGPRKDDAALAHRALASLTASFDDAHRPQQIGGKLLWAGPLPDGDVVAVLQTAEVRADGERLFVNFYVEPESAVDTVQGVWQRTEVQRPDAGGEPLRVVSAYLDGPQPYIVVVGAPTTGQLEFSTDARRFTSVDTVDGVGAVAVTKNQEWSTYRVRVYDGDGVVVYEGPPDGPAED
jgi:hypothetical protein